MKIASERYSFDIPAPQAVDAGGYDGAQESRLLVRMLLEDGLKEVEG
ncbi:hypothetical protein QUA20_02335 [Microcoleus sp. Pol7_A1]